MNVFKEKCIKLRRLDYTLPEISKITGRPKNSVYFHIKNIPLSPQKQELIRKNYASRISVFSAMRKGKSARAFGKFAKWHKKLICLIAHLIFDGEIRQSGCIYSNRNRALLDKVAISMRCLYKFEPIKYTDQLTKVKRLSYNNVALAIYLKEKSVELLNKIISFPKPLKKEFLAAFFDDEGCMDFRIHKRTRRIRGYQKDTKILILVQKLLKDFGIVSTVQEPNEIVITGKINLEKFQKNIGFSLGVFINGHRSNSIWKKSIEKRHLLDQAIKSFKS